ncbi:threonine/serine dehydratase [Trebonia kvetii]|uniref:threonine ammonia-lyase n=1 Tax=Trebonia kvetii TaxID=2480626 RepID=A0A6P2BR40_9ACTN|nr:threonine/serine dehydratase [Trebonia kvetii]TVZ01484.1 threonine/serine dehydratase [Trebonia kvetii]
MTDLVTIDDIRAAAVRLNDAVVRTPLVPFAAGAPLAGGRSLLVKPESLQPTGAFKLRGAYNAVYAVTRDLDSCAKPDGVVAHSSGNHGYAVGYAARLLGIRAAIVVPENAPAVKTDAIASTGAELVRVEPTLAARIAATEEIARVRGYHPVPPFDSRDVIAGQGTIGLEIADDFAAGRAAGMPHQSPAAVLVPVSGGGLISGIATALKALLPGVRVIGVEPELAADARDSLRAGARVAWTPAQTARTRADALRVEEVGELTFPHMQAYVDDIVTVSEDEMLDAVRRLALQARLIAEPGGAAAVAAALYRDPAELGLPAAVTTAGETSAPLVAVLSGGNIDPTLLAEILRTESYTG